MGPRWSEIKEREIDVDIFPKIPDYRFTTSSRLMKILPASDWHNAIMNCWDERYYKFIGWTDAVGPLSREGQDVVLMFERRIDAVQYWYHASIFNILGIQELKKKNLKS